MEAENGIEVQKTGYEENSSLKTSRIMIIMGIAGMLSWICMFSLGLLINSKIYRDAIVNHFDIKNFFISMLTFTPTNIAIICVVAAFTGGCASRLVLAHAKEESESEVKDADKEKKDSTIFMNENPFSSMVRGLVVYFSFLAGVFVATPNPFADTSPQQYAQAAGVVSLFSFIVGYDPTVFRSLLSFAGKLKQKQS